MRESRPRASKKTTPANRTGEAKKRRKTAGSAASKDRRKPAAKRSTAKAPVKNPDLIPVFEELKPLLRRYAPPFVMRDQSDSVISLWGPREVLVGKKTDFPFFSSLIIQKGFVGFYFMPIYMEPERFRKMLASELLKLLKGKSCFHVKKLDPHLKRHIQAALELGAKSYREKDWI